MDWLIKQTIDRHNGRDAGWNRQNIQPLAYPGNNNAHTWAVEVLDNSEPADLTGCSVTADFVRPDNATVHLDGGTIDGNTAKITFDSTVYAVEGMVRGTLNLVSGNTITTIAAITFNVAPNLTGDVIDPGDVVPSLAEIQALAASMRGTVAADTAYRAHLTGLRTLTDTATVLENKLIYAGGTNAGKLVTNVNYNCLIISVPSGVASLAYTRYTVAGQSTIGMCFWDGVATDDMPYGDLLKAERAAENRPTGGEWETSIISVPTGAVYAGFTWRKSLSLENFNVMDATVYARSLEGRVAALEQAITGLTASAGGNE